jgi:hypothetical protein
MQYNYGSDAGRAKSPYEAFFWDQAFRSSAWTLGMPGFCASLQGPDHGNGTSVDPWHVRRIQARVQGLQGPYDSRDVEFSKDDNGAGPCCNKTQRKRVFERCKTITDRDVGSKDKCYNAIQGRIRSTCANPNIVPPYSNIDLQRNQ